MAWLRYSSRFTIVTVALCLGLAANMPAKTFAQSNSSSTGKLQKTFTPPPTENPAPTNTRSAATRGGSEEESPDELAAEEHSPDELAAEEESPDELAAEEHSPDKR